MECRHQGKTAGVGFLRPDLNLELRPASVIDPKQRAEGKAGLC